VPGQVYGMPQLSLQCPGRRRVAHERQLLANPERLGIRATNAGDEASADLGQSGEGTWRAATLAWGTSDGVARSGAGLQVDVRQSAAGLLGRCVRMRRGGWRCAPGGCA
jgi:hypothetical protein